MKMSHPDLWYFRLVQQYYHDNVISYLRWQIKCQNGKVEDSDTRNDQVDNVKQRFSPYYDME